MCTVISIENVSKTYRLGDIGGGTLREDFARWCAKLRGNPDPLAKIDAEHHARLIGDLFLALDNVSFEVKKGEVLGIIGRNGAGKSTLLKVLSQVTSPSAGQIKIRGRIASLLEVGTGFHPELTGRENVFLNGAILGMTKAEVRRKFDAIVAFAEIEQFIDTPVKRYSSGMYVRLAFAVAAHLEPEILILDEVLAVGDASFQKKCLGKMGEVSSHGRTIIFVSHNSAAVARLCDRCVYLEAGRVIQYGSTGEVMSAYLRSELKASASREWEPADAPGNEIVRLFAVRARTTQGNTSEAFDIRQPIGIDVVFDVLQAGQILAPNIHVYNEAGVNVFVAIDQDPIWRTRSRPAGRYTSTAWIPPNFCAEGYLTVGAAVTTFANMKVHFDERDVVAFQVIDSTEGDSSRGEYTGTLPGVVRPLLKWETAYEPEPSAKPLLHRTVPAGDVGR